jgi:hypothetical protein
MSDSDNKKKKRVNSKAKGNAGELAIAKALNEALTPFIFKRVTSSGAILGGQNAVNLDHYTEAGKCAFVGDVFCSNDNANVFRFCIESKSYKDVDSLEHLFRSSKIYDWLTEVDVDRVKIDKDGIVIFKFNRTPHFAAVRSYIEFPNGVNYLTLVDGSKVCHLADLLPHRDFWFKQPK